MGFVLPVSRPVAQLLPEQRLRRHKTAAVPVRQGCPSPVQPVFLDRLLLSSIAARAQPQAAGSDTSAGRTFGVSAKPWPKSSYQPLPTTPCAAAAVPHLPTSLSEPGTAAAAARSATKPCSGPAKGVACVSKGSPTFSKRDSGKHRGPRCDDCVRESKRLSNARQVHKVVC